MAMEWQKLQADKGYTRAVHDDDQSTAVPSDVLDGTVSDLSTWDTGNLEELSSCGVLSSSELRAARLQNIQRTSGTSQAKAKAKPKAKASVALPVVSDSGASSAELRRARLAETKGAGKGTSTARPKPACAPRTSPTSQSMASIAENKAQPDDDDRSTAAPSDSWDGSVNLDVGGSTSAELRAQRLQSAARPSSLPLQPICAKPAVAQSVRPKSAPKAKPAPAPCLDAGSTLNCHLNKSSREAIRDMGLWEHMPARNPVVTRTSAKGGADWNIGFEEYQHTLGGVADAKPVERPHEADEAMRHMDNQSREAIKELGLWEHMPVRNPVVTRTTDKGGADWHVGFGEYQHTLGGVPDAKLVERPHKADEMTRSLDVQSREAIKEMGLWEHMPARNPVVTRTSDKGGADWHVGFGEYVHTLGGVPDARPVERPHEADVLCRHLDKASRETVNRTMGKNFQMGGLTNSVLPVRPRQGPAPTGAGMPSKS